jgi:polyphosphate kinase 2 (PPK2 family)
MVIRKKNQTAPSVQNPKDQAPVSRSKKQEIQTLQEPNKGLGLDKKAPKVGANSSSLVSSPMFLGVSRSQRKAKAEYKSLCEALKGVQSGNSEELCRALASLGYEKKDSSSHTKGDDQVKLTELKLGNNTGHKITFSRGKKCFEAISFSDSVIPIKLWNLMQERFEVETSRFSKARIKNPKLPLPTDLQSLKDFVKLGLSKKDRKKDKVQDREISKNLDALATKLSSYRTAGTAPKGVVIYVAGPDAAGKSSTGAIVMGALEKAGYKPRRESFKAPTKEERAQHWLKRFERGVPEEGEAVFWDRGPAGDSVYGNASDERSRVMGKEFSKFEAALQEDGVLMVKVELFADLEKQAKTFGKRLGRQFLAQTITQELQQSGTLTDTQKVNLDTIADKVDAGDFRALANYQNIQSRFLAFTEKSGDTNAWLVTDATKRHRARLGLIQEFDKALATFVAA